MVLMMLCWTDLLDYHSTVDEETNLLLLVCVSFTIIRKQMKI